jgi:hypothetical protein
MSVSITGDDSDANAVPTGALPPARGLQGKSRHGMKAVSAAKEGNLGQLKMKVSGRLIEGRYYRTSIQMRAISAIPGSNKDRCIYKD